MGIEGFAGRRIEDVKQSARTLRDTPAGSLVGQFPMEVLKFGSKSVADIIGITSRAVASALGTTVRIAVKGTLASIPLPGVGMNALDAAYSLTPRAIEARVSQPGGIAAMISRRREAAETLLRDRASQPPRGPVGSGPDGTADV